MFLFKQVGTDPKWKLLLCINGNVHEVRPLEYNIRARMDYNGNTVNTW